MAPLSLFLDFPIVRYAMCLHHLPAHHVWLNSNPLQSQTNERVLSFTTENQLFLPYHQMP